MSKLKSKRDSELTYLLKVEDLAWQVHKAATELLAEAIDARQKREGCILKAKREEARREGRSPLSTPYLRSLGLS